MSIYSDQCTNLYTEKTIQHVFNQYTLTHQQHVKVSQIKKKQWHIRLDSITQYWGKQASSI